MVPGDTLRLMAGTYTTPIDVSSLSGGTSSTVTTFTADAGPGTVTVNPSDANAACIAGTYDLPNVAWIIFDGIKCDGGNAHDNPVGWTIYKSHHITFKNGEITGWKYNGMLPAVLLPGISFQAPGAYK
jgi:hypothetical protein